MIRTEFENLKSYFKVLQNRMAERDKDCAEPKNAVDDGYSLAVSHMNGEIETILHELEMQIFPASDNRVVEHNYNEQFADVDCDENGFSDYWEEN